MGAARRVTVLYADAMIIAVIMVLCVSMPLHAIPGQVRTGAPSARIDAPEDGIKAFSGIHRVSDFASTIIYGEDLPVRGRLGHFSWSGDVNGDGLNDLIVAAPGAPGVGGFEDEGRIYIFYGKNGSYPKVLDLDQVEPDILIISNNTWFKKPDPALPYPVLAYLTNEFDVGDLDGDGIQDMVMAIPGTDAPVWGAVVYGPEGGFPGRITVHLQRSSVFSVVPGDLRYQWLSSTFLAPGQDNMVLPNYMMVKDIDRDGADELIVGSDGTVRVRWGRSGSWTTLAGGSNDRFGWALDIGDVNGDSDLDLLIGASMADDPVTGRTDCGAAYIIFNLSQFKGISSISIGDVARPTIYGSSDNDMFGRNVMLCDVDGDGKDDIVVAAPDADGGPGIVDCGRVYGFRGGENTTFPSRMVSDDNAYWTVIGNRGKEPGTNPYPGDRLGAVMEAGDVDGDGRSEVVFGIYNRPSNLSKPTVVDSVGMVAVFEAADIFPNGGGILRLGETDGTLVIEGDAMRDTLGWNIFVGDVTNDGVDDIIVGAPAADGPEDQRTSDGEAYIITGSSTSLGPLKVSGKGHSSPYLLPGGNEVRMEVDFVLTGQGRSAAECSLTLGSEGKTSRLAMGPAGMVTIEGELGIHPVDISSSLQQKDGRGTATFMFIMDWSFLKEGPLDIMFQLKDDGGTMFYRVYPSVLTLTKDLALAGELEVQNATGLLSGIGQWVLPGDVLHLSGASAVYAKADKVQAPDGSVELVLREGPTVKARKPYSADWSLEIVVPVQQGQELSLSLELPERFGSVPPDMDLTGTKLFRLNIDLSPPLPPVGLRAVSTTTGLPEFDGKGRFDLSWNGTVGPEQDPGGSGVKEFQVLSGGRWVPAIKKGGLVGSYFRGRSYQEQAFFRVDAGLNFTTRDWGPFGPDPYRLRYDDFSVRWHGHFVPTMNGSHLISLKGSGTLILKLDGTVLLPKTEIVEGVELTMPVLDAGSYHPFEVHFSNAMGSSYFSMEVWDPALRKLARDELPFHHPTNGTSSVSLGDPEAGISVRSLDWTGRHSVSAVARAYKDTGPPVVVAEWTNRWFNTTRPALVLTVADPWGENASGVDVGSLAYSLEREGIARPIWQTVDMKCQVKEQGRYFPVSVTVALDPYLEDGWRGELLLTASDMTGNRVISDPVWVGVDTTPPEISLLQPVEGSVLYGTEQQLTISFYDGTGSGADSTTIMLRTRRTEGTWSDWVPLVVMGTSRPDVLTASSTLDLGRSEVQLMGSDIAMNRRVSRTYVLTVMEPPVNVPPIPRISYPTNGTRYYVGQLVELSAVGTWDDGLGPNEELELTWSSSRDGYIGTGPLVKARLSLGQHNITLFADDGAPGHNISVTVTIHIVEYGGIVPDDDRPPGSDLLDPLSLFALFALLVVVLVLLGFVIVERKGGIATKDGSKLPDDGGPGSAGPEGSEE